MDSLYGRIKVNRSVNLRIWLIGNVYSQVAENHSVIPARFSNTCECNKS